MSNEANYVLCLALWKDLKDKLLLLYDYYFVTVNVKEMLNAMWSRVKMDTY